MNEYNIEYEPGLTIKIIGNGGSDSDFLNPESQVKLAGHIDKLVKPLKNSKEPTFIEQTLAEYHQKFGEDAPASDERVDDFLSEKLKEARKNGLEEGLATANAGKTYEAVLAAGQKAERTRIIGLVECMKIGIYPPLAIGEADSIVRRRIVIQHDATLEGVLTSLKEESV